MVSKNSSADGGATPPRAAAILLPSALPSAVRSALLSGVAIGCVLGAISALLYVAIDANLRPQFGFSLQRSGPRMLASFAAVGCFIAGVCSSIPASIRSRRAGCGLALLLLPLGVGLSALASPAAPQTLVPRAAGLILTGSDLVFLAAVALLTLVVAYPLVRWALWLIEGRWRGGWVATGLGVLAITAALLLGRGWNPNSAAGASLPNSNKPVVLIGIDGADWREINELLERDRLPVFAKLIAQGATGSLSTFRPTLSPIIWTSIATGRRPYQHGIQDFLEPGSGIPYTSNTRRVPALWTLLSDAQQSVGVVGWWVTWPAEAVNGYVVSAYSNPDQHTIKGSLHADMARQTHPPELIEELGPLMQAGVEWGKSGVASMLESFPGRPEDPLFDNRVEVTSFVLGADYIFSEAAAHIAERYSPRFLAVYLSAPDTSSHAFCAGRNNPWRERVCGRVIEAAYREVDRAIGRVLSAVAADATVMIVSDHGFDRARGHEHGLLHGPPGIIILTGEGVRPGGEISAASIYDIAPTILSLFGLPIPSDLRGRVLLSAFEPSRVEDWHLAFGPSLVTAIDSDSSEHRAIPSATDEELKERLRVLGYIE